MYLKHVSSGACHKPIERRPRQAVPSEQKPWWEDARRKAAAAGVLEDERRRRAAAAAEEEEERRCRAQERAAEHEEMQRRIEEDNKAANERRREQRRGAGSASFGVAQPIEIVAGPEDAVPVNVDVSNRTSNRSARRQKKKANILAAATRKAVVAEAEATQQFLRETAMGFTEHPEPAYPIDPLCPPKGPRARTSKKLAEPSDKAEDLLFGLWEAKLKYPGVAR